MEKVLGVKRIEFFSPPDAEHPETVIEFFDYQLSSGIWHPRKIKRVDYWMKAGVRQIFGTTEWEIRQTVFNAGFPDNFFQDPAPGRVIRVVQ